MITGNIIIIILGLFIYVALWHLDITLTNILDELKRMNRRDK